MVNQFQERYEELLQEITQYASCKNCKNYEEIEHGRGYCDVLNAGDYAVSPCRVCEDFYCSKFKLKEKENSVDEI